MFPSTHNVLIDSAVEGVEGKTDEFLFDEDFAFVFPFLVHHLQIIHFRDIL